MTATLRGSLTSRPPVWIMRQAGRYLPEYRALKQDHGFLGLVQTPELAAEVSMQPLRRFPLDAAILFSDILVIPEAMGQPYGFRDVGGIEMPFAVDSPEAVQRLDASPATIEARLAYIPAALRHLREMLTEDQAMLGFCGAPWTLACFMAAGGSGRDYSAIKRLRYAYPQAFEALMERITAAVITLCRMSIAAGADAIQIFDSLGAECSAAHYERDSLRWVGRIIAALGDAVPVILFAKHLGHRGPDLLATGASALSLDASVSLPGFRAANPGRYALQGNLDATVLETTVEAAGEETRRLLASMRGQGPHVVNLGHGITPRANIACVEAMVAAVTEFA